MSLTAATPQVLRRIGGDGLVRARLVIRGAVQGVGFRPFIFRLATDLRLGGRISNTAQGVLLEIEGEQARVERFILRIEAERPPNSSIQSLETTYLETVGHAEFQIRPSVDAGEKSALVMPDIATCPECLREILDPANRRFGYPFTNCTHCGPRYSILQALPYDRRHTSMSAFTMCPACQAEYDDPRDRRFHAQPNACPQCGPHVELWDRAGRVLGARDAALPAAVRGLREGAVLAVKGLGGFHLVVPAHDDAAVQRLRALKHREEKPFALMFPTFAAATEACVVSEVESRLLRSSEAPIVWLRRRPAAEAGPAGRSLAASIAPGNPYLGVMLPHTPLHHLLLGALGEPVVATSGNLADEPICTDEREALDRLGGIADLFLVHNRPIVRHVDDSIVRVVLGRELVLRRARGYAPLPILVRDELRPTLAVGAHLKNTVALARGRQVFLSQHIGDLETAPALAAFERVLEDLQRLFGTQPELVAADAHPDYLSTKHASRSCKPVICVQHHYAHVLACMAENDVAAPLLGVSWDGTGFGVDETIWGGEFFRVTERSFQRVGHLRTFRLPGGEKAVQEPRRAALGVLHTVYGDRTFAMKDLAPLQVFQPHELAGLRRMLQSSLHAPATSSAGRLFDAVALLIGLRHHTRFEGQAAMDLEFALEHDESEESYRLPVVVMTTASSSHTAPPDPCPRHAECRAYEARSPRLILDWGPMIEAIVDDLRAGVPAWEVSAKFHNSMAEGIVAVARRVGERRVVLSGGCFQNRYLLERVVERLHTEGFTAYWHQRVPPNDGGIALGQILAANRPQPSDDRPCA